MDSDSAFNTNDDKRLFSNTVLKYFAPSKRPEFLTYLRSLDLGFEKETMQEDTDTVKYLNSEYAAFLEAVLSKQGEQLEELQRKLALIENENHRVHEMYKAVCDNRLHIIEQQQATITAYRRRNIIQRLKFFFRPRLGSLFHHSPKFLYIPKHYRQVIDLQSPPVISIVTPSYNQADYLERTITSVINQQYPKLEYIIQDGASIDTSSQILIKHESSLKHWESKKDQGQSNAINLGFQHTTGEIMAYLNSDDILLPGTLAYVA